MDISGRTRVFGIIADPIHQVRSPQAINALFAEHGADAVFVPFQVRADGLADFLGVAKRVGNLGGLAVTVPHKTAAVCLCDELTDRARLVRAVNVIRIADGRLFGDNFDGVGFVNAVQAAGGALKGSRVYLAGAGGAARAIAFSVLEAGAARLTIANRNTEKAADLCDALSASFPDAEILVGDRDPSGHEVVVNATSSGMLDTDQPPLDLDLLDGGMMVADIVMARRYTPLLTRAEALGCRLMFGQSMLDQQVRSLAGYLLADQ